MKLANLTGSKSTPLVQTGVAFGIALVLALAIPRAGAQDKPQTPASPAPAGPAAPPKPPRFAVNVPTKVMDAPAKGQEGQYNLCNQLATYGFGVESRVATSWDKWLKKAGVTVPAPADKPAEEPKPGDPPKPAPPAPDYVVEGHIDLHYRPTTFMGKTQAHNFLADVEATVKDAQGKVVQTIAFQHYTGSTVQDGQEDVAKMVEGHAYRFLICKFLKLDIVATNVLPAKKAEYTKFVADEEKYMNEKYCAPPKGVAGAK